MNTSFNDIIEALTAKRNKITLNTDKNQNRGAYMLAEWEQYEEHVESIIMNSLIRMQRYFSSSDDGTLPGSTKLTAIASSIGNEFLRKMKRYDPEDQQTWRNALQLGCIVFTVMCDKGLIIVDRNCGYLPAGSRTAPYVIHATNMWNDLGFIIEPAITKSYGGIQFTKPCCVGSYINKHTERPYVKRMYDANTFHQMEGTVFAKQLDRLQQTAWRINKDVAAFVSSHEWKNDIPKIPKAGDKQSVEASYKEMQKQDKLFNKNLPNTLSLALEEYERKSNIWAVKRNALKARSKIIDRMITVEKVKGLKGVDRFFYNIEADYRGRVYYVEPFLNYQGGDLAKACIEFADPVELTPAGMRWLKIHAAACFNQSYTISELLSDQWTGINYVPYLTSRGLEDISVDKMSLDDRVRWVDNNMEFILSTAVNGTVHHGDECEKPWMFIAACLEIYKASLAEARGEKFLTRLPVPVDGTCNGGQHAAAINKDTKTASMVGLIPQDHPVDLYVEVGKEMVFIAPTFFSLRNIPYTAIRKNISKRATMTRAYSAGRRSIADSMFADCHKNNATVEYDITASDCYMLSGVAMEAIDIVCPANASVRYYLQELVKFELGKYAVFKDGEVATNDYRDLQNKIVAVELDNGDASMLREQLEDYTYELVYGNGRSEVDWVSPSGFIVNCKLNNTMRLVERVSVGDKQVKIVGVWSTDRPDMRKHISAIAANYIHSLDAAHQAATVVSWFAKGKFAFAAVHDSYAVHASDVDELVYVIKDEFVKMYDVDNFYDFIRVSILSTEEGFDEPAPRLGKLDIHQVYDSDYFFN